MFPVVCEALYVASKDVVTCCVTMSHYTNESRDRCYMSRNDTSREAMDKCLMFSTFSGPVENIILSITDSIDVQIIVTATCEQPTKIQYYVDRLGLM